MSEAANTTSTDNNGDSGLNGKRDLTKFSSLVDPVSEFRLCGTSRVIGCFFIVSFEGLWQFNVVVFVRFSSFLSLWNYKGEGVTMSACVYWQWSHQ